jgi:hypothetical protein
MAERSVTSQLDQLLQGRNTTWYKGRLGLLNLIVVSPGSETAQWQISLRHAGIPLPHSGEQRV